MSANIFIVYKTTSAAQVFIMQLGFLAFEVGFVSPIWVNSIIIKNVEDTIVGTLTYILIGFTLTSSTNVYGKFIGSFDNILLINVSKLLHETIFINTCYAITCATIISGAVLERMKNFAYVSYTFLILLINYPLASYWAWNKNSWLVKLGFVDCAGSFVVHAVGGVTAMIACHYLSYFVLFLFSFLLFVLLSK